MTLAGVYVLIGLHIAHWKLTGSTLAPLELNEVMYTLELGIVTAGFIFMAAAFLSAAIFGRFFCSWGCHILALEDLCAWLLDRLHIRPRPIRSRMLLFVPPAALFYMFIWPQVARIWRGDPSPGIHLFTDAQGWASFVTTDFWRNLPGPWITALTFATCGFAIVYVLGSRAFCTYGCPYGVLFRFADQFAPGRIIAVDECQQCGTCTATCSSGVRVHEEILAFGNVVNPACMKDLDCVSACPHDVLRYGMTRPAWFRTWSKAGRAARRRYDFTLLEDALMAIVFIATLLIFRGLYDAAPFLMTLGLGGILSYLAVVLVRLCTRRNVSLGKLVLRRAERWTGTGRTFVAYAFIGFVFIAHSGFIRWHEYAGRRALDYASALPVGQAAGSAAVFAGLRHAGICEDWGLVRSTPLLRRLAALHELNGSPTEAQRYLREVLRREPRDAESRLALARALTAQGSKDEAVDQLEEVLASTPRYAREAPQAAEIRAAAHELLGGINVARGDATRAIADYTAALGESPNRAAAHFALGELLGGIGRLADAVDHLKTGLAIQPSAAPARYNLAVMLAALGHEDAAIEQYGRLIRAGTRDPDVYNNLGLLFAGRGQYQDAASQFEQALTLNANHARAHFNLGRLLRSLGRLDEAGAHLLRAAALDPAYAEWLERDRAQQRRAP